MRWSRVRAPPGSPKFHSAHQRQAVTLFFFERRGRPVVQPQICRSEKTGESKLDLESWGKLVELPAMKALNVFIVIQLSRGVSLATLNPPRHESKEMSTARGLTLP